MRRVFVQLDDREIADLVIMARELRRRPQDQAALWISERLKAERSAVLTEAVCEPATT